MGEAVRIGLDIAKSVFQVHGVDAEGEVVLRRRLTRARVLAFFAGLAPCRRQRRTAPTTSYPCTGTASRLLGGHGLRNSFSSR